MKKIDYLCKEIYEELNLDKFCYITCDEKEFYLETSQDLSEDLEDKGSNYLCLTQFDVMDLDFNTFLKEIKKHLLNLVNLELNEIEDLKTMYLNDKEFIKYLDKKIEGYKSLKSHII